MDSNRGTWIGFTVSGLCFGMVILVVLSAVFSMETLAGGFAGFCHQIDDRCYQINGETLPICVRCAWIYFGLAVGHTLFLYWKPNEARISQALVGAIALMVFDVWFEFIGFYENSFGTRALTGFFFGLVLSHFTLLGLREIYCERFNPNSYVRRIFLQGRTH